MHEYATVERELAELPDIYATQILKDIRRIQLAYQIDWGKRAETLELGVGQWGELCYLLSEQGGEWRECIQSDPPMLWGMRIVQVPSASGLMAR